MVRNSKNADLLAHRRAVSPILHAPCSVNPGVSVPIVPPFYMITPVLPWRSVPGSALRRMVLDVLARIIVRDLVVNSLMWLLRTLNLNILVCQLLLLKNVTQQLVLELAMRLGMKKQELKKVTMTRCWMLYIAQKMVSSPKSDDFLQRLFQKFTIFRFIDFLIFYF